MVFKPGCPVCFSSNRSVASLAIGYRLDSPSTQVLNHLGYVVHLQSSSAMFSSAVPDVPISMGIKYLQMSKTKSISRLRGNATKITLPQTVRAWVLNVNAYHICTAIQSGSAVLPFTVYNTNCITICHSRLQSSLAFSVYHSESIGEPV